MSPREKSFSSRAVLGGSGRRGPRAWLRGYGWIFLGTGLAFVAVPEMVLRCMSWAARALPGAAPLSGAGLSLWLGLSGSLMSVISLLSLSLAANPNQPTVWNALLLSKAVSSGLFAAFAALEGNPAYLVGTAVDGGILLHLAWLRLQATSQAPLRDPWAPRLAGNPGLRHETWFIEFRDPTTRSALWVRYGLRREPDGLGGELWWVFFDGAGAATLQGRRGFPPKAVRVRGGTVDFGGEATLSPGRAFGRDGDASWDLSWESGNAPPFEIAPEALLDAGLTRGAYADAAGSAVFAGRAQARGRSVTFSGAPGCAGHLWGRGLAAGWRWAHAALREEGEEVVFEILSARERLGPLMLPPLTVAHLWFRGQHYASGLRRVLRCGTSPDAEGWSFRAEFDGLTAEGRCVVPAGLAAEWVYESGGRGLLCRNSGLGTMELRILDASGRQAAGLRGGASVESVEESA